MSVPEWLTAAKGCSCDSKNPDFYKVACEDDKGRMIEMTLPAGKKDVPHDHPLHYLYVVTPAKLKLTPPPGAPLETPGVEVELPAGAGLVVPAGPHCVENIGTTDVKIIFFEPKPLFSKKGLKGIPIVGPAVAGVVGVACKPIKMIAGMLGM